MNRFSPNVKDSKEQRGEFEPDVLVELNNPQDKTEGRVVRILNRDLKNLVGCRGS